MHASMHASMQGARGSAPAEDNGKNTKNETNKKRLSSAATSSSKRPPATPQSRQTCAKCHSAICFSPSPPSPGSRRRVPESQAQSVQSPKQKRTLHLGMHACMHTFGHAGAVVPTCMHADTNGCMHADTSLLVTSSLTLTDASARNELHVQVLILSSILAFAWWCKTKRASRLRAHYQYYCCYYYYYCCYWYDY